MTDLSPATVRLAEMLMTEADHLEARIAQLVIVAPPDKALTAALLTAARTRDHLARWLTQK